jgi:hypothetical protein
LTGLKRVIARTQYPLHLSEIRPGRAMNESERFLNCPVPMSKTPEEIQKIYDLKIREKYEHLDPV